MDLSSHISLVGTRFPTSTIALAPPLSMMKDNDPDQHPQPSTAIGCLAAAVPMGAFFIASYFAAQAGFLLFLPNAGEDLKSYALPRFVTASSLAFLALIAAVILPIRYWRAKGRRK